MKNLVRVIVLVLVAIVVGGLLPQAISGESSAVSGTGDQRVYLPLVLKPGPTPIPTPTPKLYVGMTAQWDGIGNIHLVDASYEVGTHQTRNAVAMIDADTLQVDSQTSYLPNPQSWPDESWSGYYSVSTGQLESSSVPPDPAFKWGTYWFLPFSVQPASGSVVYLDDQAMIVSGPFSGSAFGQSVTFWQMVNRDQFLCWWDGTDRWKQYVEPGDATLRYVATGTRLLMYSDVKRTEYLDDVKTSFYVRYVEQLTSTNVAPGTQSLRAVPRAESSASARVSVPADMSPLAKLPAP